MLVSMKKATLYALKEDREAILIALQKEASIMLIAPEKAIPLPGADKVSSDVDRTRDAIKFIEVHGDVSSGGILAPRKNISYTNFLNVSEDTVIMAKQVEALNEKITALRNEVATMVSQVEQMQPWLNLSVPLEDLKDTETTDVFVGYIEESRKDDFLKEIKEIIVEPVIFDEAPEGRAFVLYVYKPDVEKLKHYLREYEFSEIVYPKRTGTPREVVRDLTAAATRKELLADELAAEVKKVAKEKDDLELYFDQLEAKKERMALSGSETDKTFSIQGWVRADEVEKVESAVDSVTKVCDLKFTDPEEGEIPPTVMQNNKIVAPFEAVTELYSRPKIGSIDPNFLVAPFQFIFFGMMLSDAGYGLILTIALMVYMKLVRPHSNVAKLSTVILFGGVSTFLWGVAFGGWFGLEWHPLLFVPMKEPLKMLALCFALGAVHLLTGMGLKIYMDIRNGDVVAAICDEASWIIMFLGFFLMAFVAGPVGSYLAIAGAAIILVTGGRAKPTFFGKIFGGLLALYDISGYLSDILSYSRLFALGLATGVVAMVINTLAQIMWNSGYVGMVFAIIVLIGGHTFNILLNVLGSFVHSSRLQYIEFFGKFYESGGRAFVPLAIRTKYTEITK